MYKTPASGRLHIGIFGRRNTGKSSLINAISGQKLAIVSDIAGTTTDPVKKAMEILPLGPCLLIDTAGIDDVGALGEERVKKTLKVLQKTDLAILVVDPDQRLGEYETGLLGSFREKKIPFIVVINKSDLPLEPKVLNDLDGLPFLKVSAVTRAGIEELKEKIMAVAPANWSPVPLVSDIVKPKQVVVLVCPIDVSMPQGRLILPEVQVLRDVMDADAAGYMTKDTELEAVLGSLKKQPDLVVTDSQAFSFVSKIVPAEVPLTSFSIVFARHRGDLNAYLAGAAALKTLKDGDRVLVAEACTHHVQPVDIGRVKIPKWLKEHTGKELQFETVAGGDFPEDLSPYKLVISCGGCMINRREMINRIDKAKRQGVPITNYGVLIAEINGILDRVIEPFKNGLVEITL